MKHIKTALVIIVPLLIAVAGFVWWNDQTALSRRESQLLSTTNDIVGAQNTQAVLPIVSRPLYGTASLTEEEKRILFRPFKDCFKYSCGSKAYMVGMICLKRHLTRAEIMELVADPPFEPEDSEYLHYRAGLGQLLVFYFDKKGRLMKAAIVGSQYQLPLLESVNPDTPIEPPPRSSEHE